MARSTRREGPNGPYCTRDEGRACPIHPDQSCKIGRTVSKAVEEYERQINHHTEDGDDDIDQT